jgi:hypothetical protein
MSILNQGYYGEPIQAATSDTYYSQYFRGYFKAPTTGNYKFYLSGAESAQIWMSTVPKNTSRANM